MSTIVTIKQVPDSFAISTGLDKYGKSRMPGCFDLYQAAIGNDGRYITGLDEESLEIKAIKDPILKKEKEKESKDLRLEIERLVGKDLSGSSNFWETFFVELSTDNNLVLNTANPMDVVKLKLLTSNSIAAPSLEESGQPKYRNSKYYCFTEEVFEKDKVSAQKLRDEARGSLLKMAESDDKMILMGQYLEGFKYKKGLKSDTLYSMLSDFINDNKSRDNVERFIRASKTSVEDLQYKVTVDKAIKNRTIKFKDGQYFRGGVNLGKSLVEVMSTLKSPEYANEFVAIHEEVS